MGSVSLRTQSSISRAPRNYFGKKTSTENQIEPGSWKQKQSEPKPQGAVSPSTEDGPEFKLKAASDLLNLDWMKDVKQCLNYRTILHLQRQFPNPNSFITLVENTC